MTDVAVGALRDPAMTVAEGINWTVNAGDYWVVAGLHGSGKSDFLMLAGGLMAPQRGQYRFFGEEMPIFEDARLAERLRLGMVFDGGHLFNHLTVADNVALPLRYHQNLTRTEAAAQVAELLACTELTPWADSAPGDPGARLAEARRPGPRALAQAGGVAGGQSAGGPGPAAVQWWLDFLDQLSKGHSLTGGRPITLVVTTADLARGRPTPGSLRACRTSGSRCSAAGRSWRPRTLSWCARC